MKLVHAVTAEAALLWAQGKIDDETLKAACCHPPQAVFLEWLHNIGEWPEIYRQCQTLCEQGAVCLVVRTGNPIAEWKLIKEGCILCSRDNPPFEPKGRWLAKPEDFRRWCRR